MVIDVPYRYYTEEIERHNDAIRYAEEAARDEAKGIRSMAQWTPSRQTMINWFKEDFNEEFTVIQDYLSGKIAEPKKTRGDQDLCCIYFAYPECFEEKVAFEDDDELSEADLAWIKNARGLVKKYHDIACFDILCGYSCAHYPEDKKEATT